MTLLYSPMAAMATNPGAGARWYQHTAVQQAQTAACWGHCHHHQDSKEDACEQPVSSSSVSCSSPTCDLARTLLQHSAGCWQSSCPGSANAHTHHAVLQLSFWRGRTSPSSISAKKRVRERQKSFPMVCTETSTQPYPTYLPHVWEQLWGVRSLPSSPV